MTPNVFMAQTHFIIPLNKVSSGKKPCGSNAASSSGDSTVMICTYVLAGLVVLLLVSRYIFYPLLKDLHKRLHRDMEDEQ